jgi:DUF1680 family protein
LLTYYQATGNEQALKASIRAADLMYDNYVVKNRSMRLASAHMGMAATSALEPIAVLYRLTGDPRYLDVIESSMPGKMKMIRLPGCTRTAASS